MMHRTADSLMNRSTDSLIHRSTGSLKGSAMKIHQLSLFLENKPGHLFSVARALADAKINILTLSLADTQQFGILRLIVKDPAKAKAVLEKAGCVVNVTEVVAT